MTNHKFDRLSIGDDILYAKSKDEVWEYVNYNVGGEIDNDAYEDFNYPCTVIIKEYSEYPPNSELYDVTDSFIKIITADRMINEILTFNLRSKIN